MLKCLKMFIRICSGILALCIYTSMVCHYSLFPNGLVTQMKRKAIEASTPETSPLKSFSNSERFTISDEDLIKKLYGIRK